MKRFLLLGVLAAVFAVLAYALTRETTLASPLIGRAAPGFAFSLFEPVGADPVAPAGSRLALSDLAGKPVVLNFWASWCLSCRDEAAVLETGWRRYGPDVAFVGIAVNDEPDAARAFIARYGKTYFLGPDQSGAVAVDYGLYGVPETFFIGPDGRVLARHVGPLTHEDLDRRLADLTAGRAGRATGDPDLVTPLDRGDDPR
ncbi:MAG TPA: redoxin domain-containing protein [Gemmatimonadota bacterium]|nr:redoxin domain-containing protein [Gemmatimonadota bacterium]